MKRTVQLARDRKAKIIWVRAEYRRHQSPWLKQFGRLAEETVDATDTLPCEPESAILEPFAMPRGGEIILTKTSWSYTVNTPLLQFLRVHGIDTVLVCGLNTSTSVQNSAFGVFEAGFRTLVVRDACCDREKGKVPVASKVSRIYDYTNLILLILRYRAPRSSFGSIWRLHE